MIPVVYGGNRADLFTVLALVKRGALLFADLAFVVILIGIFLGWTLAPQRTAGL
jgi:hypothetical protein